MNPHLAREGIVGQSLPCDLRNGDAQSVGVGQILPVVVPESLFIEITDKLGLDGTLRTQATLSLMLYVLSSKRLAQSQ